MAGADSSSVEWIKPYFIMPADYSVALPGKMTHNFRAFRIQNYNN